MINNLVEKLKKQNWTFTFIGTDNLDVEGTAGAMGIDNHLSFAEDEQGTREMFRRESLSRVHYNQCVAEDRVSGDYFNVDDKDEDDGKALL